MKISFHELTLSLLSAVLVSACSFDRTNPGETVTIDFSAGAYENTGQTEDAMFPTLRVAVSAIISPKETFTYYSDLFQYISRKTGVEVEFKQRKTYEEVNLMLKNREVDLAFICSGAYANAKESSDMEILAIPVCGGKSMYQAYVIVHKTSPVSSFNELKNKAFAFTDPMSHTGKLYPDMRVKEAGETPEQFFSKTIFSHGHDISMQLVSKQLVDGATVNGLIYNYIEKTYPGRVENIKIIEKSEYYGMPPVVIPASTPPEEKKRLRELITSLHEDAEGKRILDNLLIDRFIPGDDADYDRIREMLRFVGS